MLGQTTLERLTWGSHSQLFGFRLLNIGALVSIITYSYRNESPEELSKALILPKGKFILVAVAVPTATVK